MATGKDCKETSIGQKPNPRVADTALDPDDLPVLPHGLWGDPECPGWLIVDIRGHQADIVCCECSVVVLTVPVSDLPRTVIEMELSLDDGLSKLTIDDEPLGKAKPIGQPATGRLPKS